MAHNESHWSFICTLNMFLKNYFSDYPATRTACLLNIGDFKLFIRILDNDSIRELMVPLRWVKSWRITKSDHIAKSISILIGVSRSSEMWITILSRDSIVISSLLYSMIQKIGPVDHSQGKFWTIFVVLYMFLPVVRSIWVEICCILSYATYHMLHMICNIICSTNSTVQKFERRNDNSI